MSRNNDFQRAFVIQHNDRCCIDFCWVPKINHSSRTMSFVIMRAWRLVLLRGFGQHQENHPLNPHMILISYLLGLYEHFNAITFSTSRLSTNPYGCFFFLFLTQIHKHCNNSKMLTVPPQMPTIRFNSKRTRELQNLYILIGLEDHINFIHWTVLFTELYASYIAANRMDPHV